MSGPLRNRLGVAVLTYNRAEQVVQTVERLAVLPEGPEIVVVDNGSTDGTVLRLRERFPDIRVIPLRENRGAAGRNAGVAALTQPYVALCDDDTWWERGSLTRAAGLLDRHPRLAVLTAQVLVGAECRLDPTSAAMRQSPIPLPRGLPGAGLLGFLAGASVIRRSALVAVGGFEPRLFIGAEEQLVALDLVATGWALSYIDELVVHHHPSPLRDSTARRRLLARNHLWISWLRRPARVAAREMILLGRLALRDAVARGALIDALGGLPWAVRNRRVVPRSIERGLQLLEAQACLS
jgi:GT2 family glycosyltransferase